MSRADLAKQFEDVFMRLLAGESGEHYAQTLSDAFEAMGNTLLSHRSGAFDGVSRLWSKRRSPRKIELTGDKLESFPYLYTVLFKPESMTGGRRAIGGGRSHRGYSYGRRGR